MLKLCESLILNSNHFLLEAPDGFLLSMLYGLKLIAVESKAHLLTLPCISTNMHKGGTSNTIVFPIQHIQDVLTSSYAYFLQLRPASIIR